MRRIVTKFTAFYLGCLGCVALQTQTHLSSVIASASVGLAGTLLPQEVQTAIYTGTFAGMCSPDILERHSHILLISIFGGVIFLISETRFSGIGGKLGAIAFLSSLLLLATKAFL